MQPIKTYCHFTAALSYENVHRIYHDTQYGFPIASDDELFGRLILEINQAGLSWNTILLKQENFRRAYHDFSLTKVSKYKEKDIERLLGDAGIIRNKLKIHAAIHNAIVISQLQSEYGSFKKWLDHYHPLSKDEWTKIFKTTFRFTGGEIVNEFLMSSGYLPGAHHEDCDIYIKVLKYKPAWAKK
ncbi:MAG: DNA-3-methyladenine glycosylase I [Saprospiraceae bacterium]